VLLATLLIACGGGKTYMRAQTVQSAGVLVQPTDVWIGGHKLWVRVDLANQGPAPLIVNRDAIVARLPNGQTVPRAVGRTTVHNEYMIPPGASHAVWVEFEEAGFDWHAVPQVTIDFTPAVMRAGQPVPVQMNVAP